MLWYVLGWSGRWRHSWQPWPGETRFPLVSLRGRSWDVSVLFGGRYMPPHDSGRRQLRNRHVHYDSRLGTVSAELGKGEANAAWIRIPAHGQPSLHLPHTSGALIILLFSDSDLLHRLVQHTHLYCNCSIICLRKVSFTMASVVAVAVQKVR